MLKVNKTQCQKQQQYHHPQFFFHLLVGGSLGILFASCEAEGVVRLQAWSRHGAGPLTPEAVRVP